MQSYKKKTKVRGVALANASFESRLKVGGSRMNWRAANPKVQEDDSPLIAQPDCCIEIIGKKWKIRYGSETAEFRNCKGVQYLAELLAAPHIRRKALDMMNAKKTPLEHTRNVITGDEYWSSRFTSDQDNDQNEKEELTPTTRASFQPRIDKRAERDCYSRLLELSEEADKARRNNDNAAMERCDSERSKLYEYLENAIFRGKQRNLGSASPSQMARQAVSQAFLRFFRKIEEAGSMPDFLAHLNENVRTEGTEYAYRPRPTIHWRMMSR